jgi:molybdopterin-guanine dinucleotide biosynthesis protein A
MIAGILLAGGKSARMGRDKAALVARGAATGTQTTLGAHAVATLRAVCWRVVCVGHGRGVPDDVPRIDDPGDGPLVALTHAIDSALIGAEASMFVVLPVDMPSVDAPLLQRLLNARAKRDARAACLALDDIGVPGASDDERRAEPLPLVLSKAGAVALRDAVAHGERRFGDAVRALAPALVRVAKMPENLNEPADFDAWSKGRPGR